MERASGPPVDRTYVLGWDGRPYPEGEVPARRLPEEIVRTPPTKVFYTEWEPAPEKPPQVERKLIATDVRGGVIGRYVNEYTEVETEHMFWKRRRVEQWIVPEGTLMRAGDWEYAVHW